MSKKDKKGKSNEKRPGLPELINDVISEKFDELGNKINKYSDAVKNQDNNKNQHGKELQEGSDYLIYSSRYYDDEQKRKEREDEEIAMALSKSIEEEDRRVREQKEIEEIEKKRIDEARNKMIDRLVNILKKDQDDIEFIKIANCLNEFETNTNKSILDRQRVRSYSTTSVNDMSLLIIEVIKVLEYSTRVNIQNIIDHFSSHITLIQEECDSREKSITFNSDEHNADITTDFEHQALEGQLVCVYIKGDGNCLWNSISVSLLGNYSFMESLRLLTASTLLKFKHQFEDYIHKQRTKYGYNHELSFNQLVSASTELNTWGDELHVLAMSLALHRPIYSYGSLTMLSKGHAISYEQLVKTYESESFHNHFRYVADTGDGDNEPILLHYNGENHYSVVLPIKENVRPPVPKSEILEPMIDKREKSVCERPDDSIQAMQIDDPRTTWTSTNLREFVSTRDNIGNSIIEQGDLKSENEINYQALKEKYDKCVELCHGSVKENTKLRETIKSLDAKILGLVNQNLVMNVKFDSLSKRCKQLEYENEGYKRTLLERKNTSVYKSDMKCKNGTGEQLDLNRKGNQLGELLKSQEKTMKELELKASVSGSNKRFNINNHSHLDRYSSDDESIDGECNSGNTSTQL